MGNIEERTAFMNNLKRNSEKNIADRVENEVRASIEAIEKRYMKNEREDNGTVNIKNNPKKKKQKFSALKKAGLVALFSTGVLAGYFVPKIPEKYEDYKKEAFERVLKNVKREIGKDNGNISEEEITILDKGGQMSSSTDKADIQVEIKGVTYRYRADIDGTITVKEDTIKNDDIVRAISIVSGAQEGNLVDAVMANNLSEKIEKGEKDYTIEAIKEQSKDKDENER